VSFLLSISFPVTPEVLESPGVNSGSPRPPPWTLHLLPFPEGLPLGPRMHALHQDRPSAQLPGVEGENPSFCPKRERGVKWRLFQNDFFFAVGVFNVFG
jgi:hypothetical protein